MSLTEVEATASPKTFASLYDNTALNEADAVLAKKSIHGRYELEN